MDYVDNVDQARIDHILRERIAMGGCYDGGDYDGMFGGVVLGGKGTTVGGRKAAKKSPWVGFVKSYAKAYGIPYGQALSQAGDEYEILSQREKDSYIGYGAKRKSAIKKRGTSKRATKKRAPAKKRVGKRRASAKRKTGKYGYPKNIPTTTQLRLLGITRKQFNELTQGRTMRQKQRIGHRYANRNKNLACIQPKRSGKFLLDEDYDCEALKIYEPLLRGKKKLR